MLYQTSQSVPFRAVFTSSKTGKTGLTVTVDVWRDGTEIVTAGSATEIGDGVYSYVLSSGSTGTAGTYVAVFKTSDSTVDMQWAWSEVMVGNSFAQAVPNVAPANPAHPLITSGTGANEINPDGSGSVSANLTPAAVTAAQNGLATAASQTTILNRLGSFAGTTASSIFAALRKLGGI